MSILHINIYPIIYPSIKTHIILIKQELYGEQLKDIANKGRHCASNAACRDIGNDLWNIYDFH